MKNQTITLTSQFWQGAARLTMQAALVAAIGLTAGCGTSKETRKRDDFFTSGSREADQRATQRMAKAEQLSGEGEGKGEEKVKEAEKKEHGQGATGSGSTTAAQAEGKMTLFERLGGEKGVAAIVEDFIPRALQDPRVNWERKGVKKSGFFNRKTEEMMWQPTEQNVAQLKKHMAQFLALATGGPARYQGNEMKAAHANMKITNAEFDAAVGDLKASLDRLQIPNKEQKELLAIVESTRPQIVTER